MITEVRKVCGYRRPDGAERIAEAILPVLRESREN